MRFLYFLIFSRKVLKSIIYYASYLVTNIDEEKRKKHLKISLKQYTKRKKRLKERALMQKKKRLKERRARKKKRQ